MAAAAVLVMGGDEDSLHRADAFDRTAQQLGGRCVLLPRVGHNCFVQAASRVNQELERHFAARAAGSGAVGSGAVAPPSSLPRAGSHAAAPQSLNEDAPMLVNYPCSLNCGERP